MVFSVLFFLSALFNRTQHRTRHLRTWHVMHSIYFLFDPALHPSSLCLLDLPQPAVWPAAVLVHYYSRPECCWYRQQDSRVDALLCWYLQSMIGCFSLCKSLMEGSAVTFESLRFVRRACTVTRSTFSLSALLCCLHLPQSTSR